MNGRAMTARSARRGGSVGAAAGLLLLLWAGGCGPSSDTTRELPVPAPATKEEWFARAQQYRVEQQPDSALVLFARAASMDSLYHEPVRELAQLQYERAQMEPEKSKLRLERLRAARAQFARLERRGVSDAELYDRLCDLSVQLNDDRGFLQYAKRYAERYPFDRQYYNLARAYFDVGDFQSVIKSAKSSVEKFGDSPYISSFYRILGRAYMKVDRDQTAERTLAAGIKATDTRIAALRKQDPGGYASGDAYRRLHDDKVQMLLLLKQLHTTYKAQDKLQQVERQLKEEGYNR
jgi:tetratricopeptide (TPR) repeat protein